MKKTNKEKERKFHIVFPPFVDACRVSNESSLKKFKEDMITNSIEWGLKSIGEQVIRTGTHKEINGCPVVQCGKYDGKKYLAIVSNDNQGCWFERIKIIESDFPEEWNVT